MARRTRPNSALAEDSDGAVRIDLAGQVSYEGTEIRQRARKLGEPRAFVMRKRAEDVQSCTGQFHQRQNFRSGERQALDAQLIEQLAGFNNSRKTRTRAFPQVVPRLARQLQVAPNLIQPRVGFNPRQQRLANGAGEIAVQ